MITRREVYSSQEFKWLMEVRRLKALLHNAEVRLDYYQGQLSALKSVPHVSEVLEAAE